MRRLVVVQSRLTSSRLPGKALLLLGGLPMVVLAARRAGRDGLDVVVATSEEAEDDAVAAEVRRHGVSCFRGSLHDPLGRFAAATAGLDDGDVVVRLTADNVAPDADLVRELTDALEAAGTGYLRTADGLPYGLSAEAFTVSLLRAAAAEATGPTDREHVTPWIRRHTDDRQLTPLLLTPDRVDRPRLPPRCTVDTLADYVLAHRAVSLLDDPVQAPWPDLLAAWADARPGAPGGPGAAGGPGEPEPAAPRAGNALSQGPWVLGTVQLGVAYGATNRAGPPDDAETERLLAAAAAAGVTHVDTARAYGLSEHRLGRSLQRGPSARLGVVTKVRPLSTLPDDAAPGWVAAEVRLSVEQSLRALRRCQVDGILVHRWADWARGGGAVADCLVALRAEGLARVVGASVSTPEELVSALGDPRVGYLQIPFNLLDRRWLQAGVRSARAERPDVVVAARSVFLQGLLAGGRGSDWPANAGLDVETVRSAVQHTAAELGRTSTADLSLAYVRGHSFVTSVVLGAETAAQVADQARLMDRPPLRAEEIEQVHRMVPAGTPVLLDPSRWATGS